jgi:hypothetical protein
LNGLVDGLNRTLPLKDARARCLSAVQTYQTSRPGRLAITVAPVNAARWMLEAWKGTAKNSP